MIEEMTGREAGGYNDPNRVPFAEKGPGYDATGMFHGNHGQRPVSTPIKLRSILVFRRDIASFRSWTLSHSDEPPGRSALTFTRCPICELSWCPFHGERRWSRQNRSNRQPGFNICGDSTTLLGDCRICLRGWPHDVVEIRLSETRSRGKWPHLVALASRLAHG